MTAPSLAARLSADHGGMDRLFSAAQAALDHGPAAEARKAVDRVWMRLAVHIRAEHKAVFPALAAARPELQPALQALREDHDFFMATLATAMKALQEPSPDLPVARAALEAVRLRLASHNALEEDRIYPAADQLHPEQVARMREDVTRELAFLPARYHA